MTGRPGESRRAKRPDALIDDASTTGRDAGRSDQVVQPVPGPAGLTRGPAAIADRLQPKRDSETQESLDRAVESQTRRKED